MLSPANCFLTLGIKNGGVFDVNNLFGNTDIQTHLPYMARLNGQSSWCTTNNTHPTLGVSVSQRNAEVSVTYMDLLGNTLLEKVGMT